MTPIEQKKRLRKECLARRLALSPEEKQAADAALCQTIASHPAFLQADLVLTFSPVRGEPDLSPLFTVAKEKNILVAYPRCAGTEMTFHTVNALQDLRPDRFGIPAPSADTPLARASDLTLCLLPGLAAGRDGTRLGYGGGFYDRFLVTFAGVCLFPIYECLLFPTLPTEKTDRRVNWIVTEKGELPPNA
ncbi:MAG: 5-formyltetrahydrofolate cyclo-ligase [Ruminococcaceae bacterium]|nr:5-formyltetrahydrofolate cyclo-ligase [Oscillospiraceae bacterium]